jgi:hypothetical protein
LTVDQEEFVVMHQAPRPYAAAGVALAGALAALVSAATAHADWQVVQIGPEMNVTYGDNPWLDQQTYYVDCSLLNAPDETFETVVHTDASSIFGPSFFSNWNMTVVQDISGNVPVGEQDNSFYFAGLDLIYHSIGVTPEAYFFIWPFGDIYFPTSFVEAVGPTFFEPALWLGLL